jgi:mono/diheme cytochrome c family protein
MRGAAAATVARSAASFAAVARSAASLAAVLLCAGAAGAQEMSLAQVERGQYLATVGNCVNCHTDFDRGGEPWTGGRELETPFGVIITPNLTFDNDTGLGEWTRDDFWRAMHEGVRRDGAQLYPAFPYPYFTRMPREDVDAIYDFLQTIQPVRVERVPEEELPAPLQVRAAVAGWNLLHFDQGVFEPDPDRSEAWNRGRYLVDGPAHCGGCHTGKNLLGGDIEDEYMRGGVLEHWFAPNIRGGENGGIAHWSEGEIVDFLRSGRTAHTIAMERMGEVVALSTQHMTEEDLAAIAVYLKSLDDAPREAADAPEAARMAAGEGIFFDNCAACHRADGSGVDYVFAALDGSNKVNAEDTTTLLRIIINGARAEPTEAFPTPFAMPAFAWKLSDEQIADVATYVRNAWGNRGGPIAASDVADLRETLGGEGG